MLIFIYFCVLKKQNKQKYISDWAGKKTMFQVSFNPAWGCILTKQVKDLWTAHKHWNER